MNTENNDDPVVPPPALPAPKPEPVMRSHGHGTVWLALLLALAAAGFSAYTWQQLIALRTDTTLTDQLRQRDNRINELQQRLEALGAQTAGMLTTLGNIEQRQRDNAEAVRRLAGSLAIGNIDLALAEVEQLLIMAVLKLSLEQDVNTALAALETADRRLAGLDVPELLATRTQLAADMNALRETEAVDITGLSLYLSDLIERVGSLPPAQATIIEDDTVQVTVDETTQPAWQRLLRAVWQEFRGMFVITRTGTGAKATLLPDETWFLHQNLRLQLETARLAVIRRDTDTLHAALQQVRAWLNDYFNTGDTAVTNILQSIDRMSALELAPSLPDISSSLETLRSYIHARAERDEPVTEIPSP